GRFVTALGHLDLVPEVEGDGRTVEAGAEVGSSGRCARRDGFVPHSRSTASGSFSPWPVRTQTTRPFGRTRATPATPAADAGSPKTPYSRPPPRHPPSS